ncbi:FxsA family protein [Teredinibacter franksiae]|uniref:FxsA family protein n=1 Tax=Teredinibacter franksiae TaxID=2761453 RepID=UPI001623E223|nr:FxsA family protein [Teredinibacter franksiae]
MRVLLVLFVLIPIVEMWLLITVGGIIGPLPTIGLVLLTAMLGLALLRQQGFSTLMRARSKMEGGQLPAREMAEGIFLAIGGALLLTPGFFTDAIGFACLIPGVRQVFIAWGMRQFSVRTSGSHRGQGQANNTIEGEFRRDDSKPD